MSGLTAIENDILHCLNVRIANNEKVTLPQLAEECHVAKSTIIKLSKKLGYSGFVEMYYQLHGKEKRKMLFDSSLDEILVEGNLQECVKKIANLLYQYKHCKNFVNSYGRDDILSAYISRKLMMFDLFAPSTYDFDMVKTVYLLKGIALFPDLRSKNPFEVKDIMKLAKEQGYYILAFSDQELTWEESYVDYFVKLKTTEYKTADFFQAKMIMLIELVLSEFSNQYYSEKQGGEEI